MWMTLLWAADDECQKIIASAFAEFDIRESRSDNFRHCGLEVVRGEGFTVSILAKGNMGKIEAASYPMDSPFTRSRNEGERRQFRSVAGALSRFTRQSNFAPLYRANRLQTAVRHANVLHLKAANRALEDATQSADCGLVF
eukprot:4683756-Pyramimonas_sp.AAC.1